MTPATATAATERKIFLIATEESGDRLGASLDEGAAPAPRAMRYGLKASAAAP